MEITAATRGRAEIDTSRPFQSVREAVGVFGGERRVPDGGSSRGSSTSSSKFSVPPVASPTLLCCLKKLEAELAEARSELADLKQRQSQMETAVSSVSVQFANSLGIFSVDLDKGKELAVVDRSAMVGAEEEEYGDGRVRSDLWVDDTRAEEWMASLEYLPSLSEALSIKMIEDDFDLRKVKSDNKAKKKQHKKQRKIAVSLVRGIFSKKFKSRKSNSIFQNSMDFYTSTGTYGNHHAYINNASHTRIHVFMSNILAFSRTTKPTDMTLTL
uniref:Uncharacterized protein n=1 Tax=Avena sativa TaxID=4498 RepID=A0ACD5ZAV6_AVESA